MSKPAKIRLVRCPKCENLLPELANYSIFQCGGCGAVLRGGNKNVDDDKISEKCDPERVLGISENTLDKSENFNMSKKGMGSSSEVLSDTVEDNVNASTIKADKWVCESNLDMFERLDEISHEKNGNELEELMPENEPVIVSRRTRQVSDWRIGERSETDRLQRNPRTDVNDVRYSQEGSSNYQTVYGNVEQASNQNEPERFNKAEYDEKDRNELLREIDELRIRVSQSREFKDNPKWKIPVDQRMHYEDPYESREAWFPDGAMGSNRAAMQYQMPDRHIARPPYNENYLEHSSLLYQNEMEMESFYTSNRGIGDPMRSQMHRRPIHKTPGTFQQPLPHPCFRGHHVNTDIDSFEGYPHSVNLHPPSCSCFLCYSKYRQVPRRPLTSAFTNNMFPDVPNNSMFYPHENPSSLDPRNYNPRQTNPSVLNSQNPQSHTSWSVDSNSEVGGFVRRRPTRVVLATSAQHCRPIAGGAPLFTCYNCFELLQLPKKFVLAEKIQKKIRCGACSTVIFFALVNGKLVSTKMEGKISKVDVSSNSTDDFQLMDKELASSSGGQGSNSKEPTEMRSLHSTTPSSSTDENSPDSFLAPGDETNSIEMLEKANLSPPIAGSPLQDHFDHSAKYRMVNQLDKGNRSGRSDQEIFMPRKVTSRQNSMQEVSLETEMELSIEYSNTGVSHDSGDAGREDQLRANKGAESFFAGIKNSFRDFSRSKQNGDYGKIDVSVNGHPIPYRQIKKAEKMAGPISPGQYWYDFRAGFWGAMDGPCLGIIPPFIEEFSQPMPENCSGGNTGVFVNGRELHQKDLELLGGRGLPTSRDRSYIIEISGRVLDEDSGEELESLGRLAPTIERVKHGFGMKLPRVAT